MLRLIPINQDFITQIWLWAEDPKKAEFFRRCPPTMDWYSAEKTMQMFSQCYFVLKNDKLIGMTVLANEDVHSKSIEFGLLLDEHDYAETQEVCEILFDYVFNHMRYNRIACRILTNRQKMMDRLTDYGFQFEGTMKGSCWFGGEYRDEYLLALTRSGYNKIRQGDR